MADCGCTLNSACMQHSLPALVAVPELRIPDRGPITVTRFAVTGPFAGKA
jgi:adenine deaminase